MATVTGLTSLKAAHGLKFTITINYINRETGEAISEQYSVEEFVGNPYDVTSEANRIVPGYTRVSSDGDAVTGTLNSNKVINVYYTKNVPITPPSPRPDPDIPDAPSGLNTDDHIAYIIGYPDGGVHPEGNITRAEVATIFFRLLTDETRDEYWSKTNGYTDVPAESWFNNAISTLSNMGIIDGYADGSFRPDAQITRAEFTKIAVSFFEYADYEYENTFTDVRDGSWYTQFIAAAAEIGLIEGYPDGTFRPDNPISRAEACTIVNRTLGRAPDDDHLLPESVMITWPDNQPGTWYYADMQEATNSHDYDRLGSIEDWTAKLAERDWDALEKLWSDSHDAPGGEVMG